MTQTIQTRPRQKRGLFFQQLDDRQIVGKVTKRKINIIIFNI